MRKSQISNLKLLLLLAAYCLLPAAHSFAQGPQAQAGQPLYLQNVKYLDGEGLGFTGSAGTWPAWNVTAGTCLNSSLVPVNVAAGSVNLTASATNYVYLNSSCVLSVSTTNPGFGNSLQQVVVTGASSVTSWTSTRLAANTAQGAVSSVSNLAGGATGSLPYQQSPGVTGMVSGNTAATDEVPVSHGTGSAAQAPTLSNSPALSIRDTGGQVYNVLTYGAVCNGSTDDSAAIQAAINAANPGSTWPNFVNHPGAGVVLIPGGCAIASSVHVRGTLAGVGQSDTSGVEKSSYLIWTGAAGSPMLIMDGRYGTVRDIALYGNVTYPPSDAILISNLSNTSYGEMGRIENVQIGSSSNMQFTNGISWNGTTGGDNFFINKVFISGCTNAGINNPTNGNASDEVIDNLSVNYAAIGVLEQGFVTGTNWAFSYVNTEMVLGKSGGGTNPYVIVRGYVGGGTPMSGTGMMATVYTGTLHVSDGGYSMVTSTANPVLDSHYYGDNSVLLENFQFQSAGTATPVNLNLCFTGSNGAKETFRLINVSGVTPSNVTCSASLAGQGYKNSILLDLEPASTAFGYYGDTSRTITTWETGAWDGRRTDETLEHDLWGGPSVIHQLSAPPYPACSATGSGSTSYGYRITSLTTTSYFAGETLPGAEVTCTNNATLSGSAYNTVTWQSVVGATGYNIYCRTPSAELLCGTVWGSGTATNTWADTGSATPSGALPTVNTTGGLYGVYDYYNSGTGAWDRVTEWNVDGNGNATFQTLTAPDKGRQVYDTQAYGTVCNGTTFDDTAAFSAAINACQASATGGEVFFKGHCLISSTLPTFTNSGGVCNLKGAGESASILTVPGATVTWHNGSTTISWANSPLYVGEVVQFVTGASGTLPSNISAGTNYYVVAVTSSAFQVSATSGGTAITISCTGYCASAPGPSGPRVVVQVAPIIQVSEGAAGVGNGNFGNSTFSGFSVNCNGSLPAGTEGIQRFNVGIHQTDTLSPTYRDIGVTHCVDGFILESSAAWTERGLWDNVTTDDDAVGYLVQQDASDGNNSFGYNVWQNVKFNTQASGDAVWAAVCSTPGSCYANLYNDTFVGKGNVVAGSHIFNLNQSQQIVGNTNFDIVAEAATTNSSAVMFYGGTSASLTNGCGASSAACVQGHGASSYLFNATNQWSGAFSKLDLSGWLPVPVGSITTTAVASEVIANYTGAVQGGGGACQAIPTNSTAAAMTGVYLSAPTSTLTIYHPATAGATFAIWCN
jgi:hypothetical protein